MPADKDSLKGFVDLNNTSQHVADSVMNRYFVGFPYTLPSQNEEYVSGIDDITDWVRNGYSSLYSRDGMPGYSFFTDGSGKVYRVSDSENINTSGMSPLSYGEMRKMLPKREYIGGKDYRFKTVQRIPGFLDKIKERAEAYGIDPNLVLNRILHEGWIDQQVINYNGLDASQQGGYWDGLWDAPVSGYGSFGLDYAGNNLMNGVYELKDPDASWRSAEFTDYEGGNSFRTGTSLEAGNLSSAIEILAADLAYRQREVAKRYGKKGSDLNVWTNAAFNMGLNNDDFKNEDWVRNQYTYPDYYGQIETQKKLGGIVERFGADRLRQYFASGGSINRFDEGGDTGEIRPSKPSNVVQRYLSDHPMTGHRLRKAGVLAADLARIFPGTSFLMDLYDSKHSKTESDRVTNPLGAIGRGTDIITNTIREAGEAKPSIRRILRGSPFGKLISLPDLVSDSAQFIRDFSEPVEHFDTGGLLRGFDMGGDKEGLWYNPDFDLGVYGGMIDPAVVVASRPVRQKKNKENDELAAAILAELDKRYANRHPVLGTPVEKPLESEDYLFGLAAIGAKAPVAGTVSAVKDVAPLWGRAGLRMLKDLPAFEFVDRLPTLFGGKRMTELGGDATQAAYEGITGNHNLSDMSRALVRMPGEFIAGVVPGVAGDVLMRTGSNAVLRSLNNRGIRIDGSMDYLEPLAHETDVSSNELPFFDSDSFAGMSEPERLYRINHGGRAPRTDASASGSTRDGLQIFNNKALRLLAENGNEAAAAALASRPYEIEGLGGGYMLKSLMRGNPLEKQISKQGTVSVNNIRALINKGSKVEQAVVDKVLASEEFAGKKAIDYNDFRKAVQDELITYQRTPDTRWEKYGLDRIGISTSDQPASMAEAEAIGDAIHRYARENGFEWTYDNANRGIWLNRETGERLLPSEIRDRGVSLSAPQLNTYTFSSPRIPGGSAKHYNENTLGHSRTYTTADEPDVLHVMESQSDWAQGRDGAYRRMRDRQNENAVNQITEREEVISHHNKKIEELENLISKDNKILESGISESGYPLDDWDKTYYRKEIKRAEEDIAFYKNEAENETEYITRAKNAGYEALTEDYLADNFTSRQIQENLRYAAEKVQTKMRYPTRETAAKIEGYSKSRSQTLQDNPELENEYKSILKKLSDEQERIVREYAPKDYIGESGRDVDFGEIGATEEWIQQRLAAERASEEFDKSAAGKEMRKKLVEAREKYNPDKWLEENVKEVYLPQHETILKKYDAFPKQYQKLFKGADVRTVTDAKGNTWYEVDVPEDYLKREWQYAYGESDTDFSTATSKLYNPREIMKRYSPKQIIRGIKNLREYKAMLGDKSNIMPGVEFAVNKYRSRADLLDRNMKLAAGLPLESSRLVKTADALNTMPDVQLTKMWKGPFVKYVGRTPMNAGHIEINPYHKAFLKVAKSDPELAIRFLSGAGGAHEGTHWSLIKLGANPLSESAGKYFRANPYHPLFNGTTNIFSDPSRVIKAKNALREAWMRSPEEFAAELTQAEFANGVPAIHSYPQFSGNQLQPVNEFLGARFQFTPAEVQKLIRDFSLFGYKNGGLLKKY